jgi:hypothetical protein
LDGLLSDWKWAGWRELEGGEGLTGGKGVFCPICKMAMRRGAGIGALIREFPWGLFLKYTWL